MNTLDAITIGANLGLARGQIDSAAESLKRAQETARVVGAVNLQPLNLAAFHLKEAATLLQTPALQSLTPLDVSAPAPTPVPSVVKKDPSEL